MGAFPKALLVATPNPDVVPAPPLPGTTPLARSSSKDWLAYAGIAVMDIRRWSALAASLPRVIMVGAYGGWLPPVAAPMPEDSGFPNPPPGGMLVPNPPDMGCPLVPNPPETGCPKAEPPAVPSPEDPAPPKRLGCPGWAPVRAPKG